MIATVPRAMKKKVNSIKRIYSRETDLDNKNFAEKVTFELDSKESI